MLSKELKKDKLRDARLTDKIETVKLKERSFLIRYLESQRKKKLRTTEETDNGLL